MTASSGPKGHPTVLVAEDDVESRDALMGSLREEGYLVLEAHDSPAILRIIKTHSRPIHLLLITATMEHRDLADRLKEFRPEMRVLFVGQRHDGKTVSDVLKPESALAKVRAFFKDRETEQITGSVPEHGSSPASGERSVSPARSMKATG